MMRNGYASGSSFLKVYHSMTQLLGVQSQDQKVLSGRPDVAGSVCGIRVS
jgi:hypothetical protein